MENDSVNHPSHYTDGRYEVIDFIESHKLDENFYYANAVKYICRAGKKDPAKREEDIRKAIWYLERYWDKTMKTNPLCCTKKMEIPSEAFLKDKGLAGTPGGLAIELILGNEPGYAIKALQMDIHED